MIDAIYVAESKIIFGEHETTRRNYKIIKYNMDKDEAKSFTLQIKYDNLSFDGYFDECAHDSCDATFLHSFGLE